MTEKFNEDEIVKLRTMHFKKAIKKISALADPLSITLTIHLVSEAILNELIKITYKENATPIFELRLGYDKKLELVEKIKLKDGSSVLEKSIYDSLKKLNKLRNKIAHNFNLDFEITNQDIENLYPNKKLITKDHSNNPISSNLINFSILVLPSMLPYYEKETGKICR